MNKIIINNVEFSINNNTLYHDNILNDELENIMNILCSRLDIKKEKKKHQLGNYSIIGQNTFDCSICLEHTKPTEYKRELKCGHVFHKKCIDNWISRYALCPLCRNSIN